MSKSKLFERIIPGMSKKMKQILTTFLISTLLFGQDNQQNLLSIEGDVKVIVGFDILPAREVCISLKGTIKGTMTDSLGHFKIDSLYSGKYILEIFSFGHNVVDTLIVLETRSKGDLKFLIIAECEINGQLAKKEIRENKSRLLLVGGIAPVYYQGQEKFEEKYGINYYDFGCTAPAHECIVAYNQVIFEYLDKEYGKKWREEVRGDVVGL